MPRTPPKRLEYIVLDKQRPCCASTFPDMRLTVCGAPAERALKYPSRLVPHCEQHMPKGAIKHNPNKEVAV